MPMILKISGNIGGVVCGKMGKQRHEGQDYVAMGGARAFLDLTPVSPGLGVNPGACPAPATTVPPTLWRKL